MRGDDINALNSRGSRSISRLLICDLFVSRSFTSNSARFAVQSQNNPSVAFGSEVAVDTKILNGCFRETAIDDYR